MAKATLTITSKNYGAWSLRGWLLCKFAGLDFDEVVLENAHPSARAELLLLAPSFRVPCLLCDDIEVWDTLAIGEFLAETYPESGLLPRIRRPERTAGRYRARCTPVSPTCARRFR
jgi:glutathione S-transferase